MTQTDKPNWIDAWLETQQSWLEKWQATAIEQRVDAMRVGMEILRQHCSPASMSVEAMSVVQSFQSLLQSCMAQVNTGDDQSLLTASNRWQQVFGTFPLGQMREQQLMWQEYLNAYNDYQLRLSALLQSFAQVFVRSLQMVPDDVAKRAAVGKPITDVNELYAVWIECGERAFANIAKQASFVKTQSDSTNAHSRLKIAEHVLLEHWLKSHDLPTRSELNSVHLKMRSMSARIAKLEHQLVKQNTVMKAKRSKKKV